MVIAHRAGIRVFVTGGIGGVHWGAEQCRCNSNNNNFIKRVHSHHFINSYGYKC